MWMHKGSVLSPSFLAVAADVVTELAREGILSKSSYANYLDLMNETIDEL